MTTKERTELNKEWTNLRRSQEDSKHTSRVRTSPVKKRGGSSGLRVEPSLDLKWSHETTDGSLQWDGRWSWTSKRETHFT